MRSLAILVALIPSIAKASEEFKALEYIARAASIEFKVDKFAKSLEKKYVNKEIRKYGKWTIITANAIAKKQVQIKWTF